MFTLKTIPLIRTLALAGLMLPAAAWAAEDCTGTTSHPVIDFKDIDVLQQTGGTISIPVTVTITCRKDSWFSRRFHVCLALDSGRWPNPTPANNGDRYLCTSQNQCRNTAPRISYNLYTDSNHSQILGNIVPSQGASNTLNTTINLSWLASSGEAKLTFYAQLKLAPNTNLTPGTYQNPFSLGSTALLWNRDPDNDTCGSYTANDGRIPFTVQATVPERCYVEADELNFGSVPATSKDIIGQTQMRVQCTRGTSYSIGLRSDNSLGEGKGAMQPLSGSNAAVPYTLHRSSPSDKNNNLWGYASNLRTSGRGDGKAQSYPVFGKVPSADYRPGKYQDTVRIEVSY